MSPLILASALCFFVSSAMTADLPAFITPCKEKDPNIVDCAVKESNKVIQIIAKGIPEAGLPDLAKYQYPEIVYNGPDAKFKLHGGVATGISGFAITNIKFDFQNKVQDYLGKFPTLELEGTYDVDGKVFDTPLKATGPFKISMENVEFIYNLKYEMINKDGDDYMRKTVQTIKLVPQNVKVNFEKLFDDAEKTAKFNQQLNENKERTVKEIVPTVAVLLDNYIHKHVFENMVHLIPYKKIFLQD